MADRLNHRIAIFTLDGEPAGQWGMHAVTPRQGEGRIHYPVDVAVAADASRAVVVEPFERRVQWFEADASAAPSEASAELPSLDGVLSHFGPGIGADRDLVALWEPETGSIIVFDWRGELPIHVTTFGGAGTAPDRFGRVVSIAVDAETQRIAVGDLANRRLAFATLDRDREARLRFDPFMGRAAGTLALERIREQAESLRSLAGMRPIDPVGLAWLPGGSLAVLDAANGCIEVLAPPPASRPGIAPLPTEVVSVWGSGTGGEAKFTRPRAMSLSPSRDALAVLDRDGTRIEILGLDGVGRPDESFDFPEGVRASGLVWTREGLAISEREGDRVRLLDRSAAESTRWAAGGRGGDDGLLWLPSGLASREDGTILVVDQGNHRVQGYAATDGAWKVVFSLGRASTRPRVGATR